MAYPGVARRDQKRVELPILATVACDVGELLTYSTTSSTVAPIDNTTYLAWDTDEPTTRRNFVSTFAGVSLEARSSKEQNNTTMAVATDGIFKFTVASGSYYIGTLVGPEKDAGGNYLDADKLQVVTDPREAIGYCVEDLGSNPGTALVRLISPLDDPNRGMLGLIRTLPFVIANVTSSANIVLNYLFGQRVKLFRIWTIEATAATGNSVLTLKNGSNSLDDTHTITATAEGTFLATEISDANAYDVFEHNDALDIVSGHEATGGTIVYGGIDYFVLPHVG